MEPELLAFFKRIVSSIGIIFTWVSITCIAALVGDHAFIQESVTVGNVLFYIWLVISLVILYFFLRKVWRGHLSN